MKLVISVDVEEEGLFSGRYPRAATGVKNVAHLHRLEFISREFGFPLTFLVSYQVARDPACQDLLKSWNAHRRAEIGAHLHSWNTPPFHDLPHAEPVPSDLLPTPLLGDKLETLLTTIKAQLGVSPRAFRMGRFDLGKKILALLPDYGFHVDSSVVPLRRVSGSPDHFLAPADPYLLPSDGFRHPPILEVPLTQVSPWLRVPRAIHHGASRLSQRRNRLLFHAFRHFGVLGIHPAWFPLPSMMWAASLHRMRGGRVLNMFLHSSELMPGATPNFRTEAAVGRLARKIRTFLMWLVRNGSVQGVTLSELLN